ncbi:MAG: hypothetical protein A2Z25_06365 [Planctomycetes bacterium RBG_16_55_9]|nr:MAG: hypothetical protein A2Z25_06365 [Planctomycetes bacterium RBG_16_55_9]
MGKATLVDRDMQAGEALLKKLDEDKFKIKAALWLYMPDPEEWRLVLASPIVDTDGPIKAYEKVQSELQELDGRSELSLQNIALVSPHDKLIMALKTTIKTGKEISHIRLTGNVINGVFIEDAYIYRLT